MQPGPTLIRMCRKCHRLFSQSTLTSGNTFGARFWTDGKRDAPMLPDSAAVYHCRSCDTYTWIDEARLVYAFGRRGLPLVGCYLPLVPFIALPFLLCRASQPLNGQIGTIAGALAVVALAYLAAYLVFFSRGAEARSVAEWEAALAAGLGHDPDKETYLRVRLWWAANDAARADQTARPATEMPESVLQNLLRLASLLDPTDADQGIMRAEIWRELGRFDEAMAALDKLSADNPFASMIRELSLAGDRVVRELPREEMRRDPSTNEIVIFSDDGAGAGSDGSAIPVGGDRSGPADAR